jgi:hypothetical protein
LQLSDVPDDPVSSYHPRFQSFVAWYGEVPSDAKRLETAQALECATTWHPERFRNDRKLHGYLCAYQLGARWWTLLFERDYTNSAPSNAENWWIESYSQDGNASASNYFYWLAHDSWLHFLHEFRGTNYGRYRK